MSDDYSRLLNLIGLILGLAGVLILFRWGMPFRVETGGAVTIITEGSSQEAIAVERIYKVCGYVGLGLLILGTMLQVVAVLMPEKKLS